MNKRKVIITLGSVITVIAVYLCVYIYRIVFYPIVMKDITVTIHSGSKLSDVEDVLFNQGVIKNRSRFNIVARWKKYDKHIHGGKYKIEQGMSINNIINLLRAGIQTPIEFVLDNVRSRKQLLSEIASQIEADTASLNNLLNNPVFLSKYNLNKDNVFTLFLPDRYELYWNTTAAQFIDKMYKVSKSFWNPVRMEKAKKINMNPREVVILASIVQLESTKPDEMPIIAGVYINRLKKGMPLQADPTVMFAVGNFKTHRVYNSQLKFDSPYNTYKYAGLPPGPICLPNARTIDKVLNYKKSDYIFFCAKDDLSGYHNFARTSEEHSLNAAKYRKAMDELDSNN
jgi:UPF0755 protein